MKTALTICFLVILIPINSALSGWIDLFPDEGDLNNNIFEVVHSDDDSTIIEVKISRIWADTVYFDNEPYLIIRAPGTGFVAASDGVGFPVKMTKRSAVCVPSLKSVRFSVDETEDYVFTGIRLASEIIEYQGCPDCSPIDYSAYDRKGWLFDEVAAMDTAFKWRALDGVGFHYNLYSYNPGSDSIRIHCKARLRITSKGNFGKPSIESWLENSYRTVFINLPQRSYTFNSSVESYQVLYVYADHADDYYRRSADKLAALRYKQGWRVHTASAHEIYEIYEPLYPAESETTWIRRFISDTLFFYEDSAGTYDLSYVGFIGPDYYDQDSLPGMRLNDDSHPPVTESSYSLPVYFPRLAVGRIWAEQHYGAVGTEGFVDRIIQNETEFIPGGWWDKFMFISQTTDLIYGYVDAAAQEPFVRGAGFDLTHYTCHDTLMGMPPAGTQSAMNATITSAFEDVGYGTAWHFGHGTHNVWYKSGGACCGSGESGYIDYDLYYHNFRYPTTVISGGCKTAREFGYEFVGRGALCYYGGILGGGDPHDFAQRIRGYNKIIGEAWQNYLIWSPRLIGDPLSRYYGPNEPSRFIITTDPAGAYYNSDVDGDSLTIHIDSDGPARWLHDTKICLTSGPFEDETPLCKVVPYAGSFVSFSDFEIASIPGLDLESGDTIFITATKKDFITGTDWILAFEDEDSISQITFDLDIGWNLVSVPIIPGESTVSNIFENADCIWKWNNATGGYVDAALDTPDASAAYWILYSHKPDSIRLDGIRVLEWEKDVGYDWNFIGSAATGEDDIPWGDNHTFVGTGFEATRTFVFYYDPSVEYYKPTMVIREGRGHLYNVRGDGRITFPASSAPASKGGNGSIGLFSIICRLPNPPRIGKGPIKNLNHFTVDIDWTKNSLSVGDRENGSPVENAMIVVMVGDSVEFHFTGTCQDKNCGSTDCEMDIDMDKGTRVLIKKPGFADYQIQPLGITCDDYALAKDIEFYGDSTSHFPEKFELGFAVPNPFNSNVGIDFDIPQDSKVTIEVYNIVGRNVTTILDEALSAGSYRATWDGRDSNGDYLPSGVYMYRMIAENGVDPVFEDGKKVTLIK